MSESFRSSIFIFLRLRENDNQKPTKLAPALATVWLGYTNW